MRQDRPGTFSGAAQPLALGGVKAARRPHAKAQGLDIGRIKPPQQLDQQVLPHQPRLGRPPLGHFGFGRKGLDTVGLALAPFPVVRQREGRRLPGEGVEVLDTVAGIKITNHLAEHLPDKFVRDQPAPQVPRGHEADGIRDGLPDDGDTLLGKVPVKGAPVCAGDDLPFGLVHVPLRCPEGRSAVEIQARRKTCTEFKDVQHRHASQG